MATPVCSFWTGKDVKWWRLKVFLMIRFVGKRQFFYDKKTSWPFWSTKYLAKAGYAGYNQILLGNEKPPTKSEAAGLDETKKADKKKLDLLKLNNWAFTNLLMAMDYKKKGKITFSIIKSFKITYFPQSLTHKAYTCLKCKYELSTAPTWLKLQGQFFHAKLC